MAAPAPQIEDSQIQPQPLGKAKHSCSITIKHSCSIVTKKPVDAKCAKSKHEVIVTREPVLSNCDCHEPEYHQVQLQAIRELIEAYSRRESAYIQLRKAYSEVILRTRAFADILVAEYLQMEKEDMKRFTSSSKTLKKEFDGTPVSNGIGSGQFDLPEAEAAIKDYIAEKVKEYETYHSLDHGNLRKLQECSWQVESLVCNPCVPRHLDALGLMKLPVDTIFQQPQYSQTPKNKAYVVKQGLSNEVLVVESNARSGYINTAYAQMRWSWTAIKVRFEPQGNYSIACLDTGSPLSLIDRARLRPLPEARIIKLASPLHVRGLSDVAIETNSYVMISIFLRGINVDGTTALAKLCSRGFYIIDGFRTGMLIGNDIIGPERISIDISAQKATIGSCGVNVVVHPHVTGDFDPKKQRTATRILLPDTLHSPARLINKKLMEKEIGISASARSQRLECLERQRMECLTTLLPGLLAHFEMLGTYQRFYGTYWGRCIVRSMYESDVLKKYRFYIPSPDYAKVDRPHVRNQLRKYFAEEGREDELAKRAEEHMLLEAPFGTTNAFGHTLVRLKARHVEEDGKLTSEMLKAQVGSVDGEGMVKLSELMRSAALD
ncbi:MAG: hypothetical protein LQ352_003834 [Teloschistes flavicans]|nr:MAG: hypothetical protein LQ352_003834 [Teloschistes flavicans]